MPIKVEASVLSLYDDFRLRRPRIDGKDASWEDVDSQVIGKLGEIAAAGGQIRIVSNTVLSPSTKAAIERLSKQSILQHSTFNTTRTPLTEFGKPMLSLSEPDSFHHTISARQKLSWALLPIFSARGSLNWIYKAVCRHSCPERWQRKKCRATISSRAISAWRVLMQTTANRSAPRKKVWL